MASLGVPRGAADTCDRGRRPLVSLRTGRADSFGRGADIGIPEIALLALLGVAVGTYGTIIGLGGGLLIVPLLLIVYKLSPAAAAATSLVVVFLNAVSATVGFLRRRRVDVRTGIVLASATIPGALVGPLIATRIGDRAFRLVFGLLLLALGIFLYRRPERIRTPAQPALPRVGAGRLRRRFTDANGLVIEYEYSVALALGISLVVGVLSSLLGIGGGVVHVPAMIHLMGVPVHIATATSQFVLAVTTLVGVLEYARREVIVWPVALAIGAGVVVGAQIGAAISHRLQGRRIVRLLTVAVVILAARLLWSVFADGR